MGTAYAAWNAQGIAEVDAVERVHFVEYGIIALLFYRAWRPRGDLSMFVLPLLAGIAVGTLEEWLQWFIPGRVGDIRDVFLNCVALACGLLFSAGIDPPSSLGFSLRAGSLRRIGYATAFVGILLAAFFYSVHLGVEIQDVETGRFRSRYTAADLARIGEDRLALWKEHPPLERPRSRSREDQYMSEALLHATERNRKWDGGETCGRPGRRIAFSRSTMRRRSMRLRTSPRPDIAGPTHSGTTRASASVMRQRRSRLTRAVPTRLKDTTSFASGRRRGSGLASSVLWASSSALCLRLDR